MKLDLDATNVREVEITREQARAYFDGKSLPEELETALDYAQGEAGNHSPQWIVIKISRG